MCFFFFFLVRISDYIRDFSILLKLSPIGRESAFDERKMSH